MLGRGGGSARVDSPPVDADGGRGGSSEFRAWATLRAGAAAFAHLPTLRAGSCPKHMEHPASPTRRGGCGRKG
eukprot:2011616-Prymnesium_polylepis.4